MSSPFPQVTLSNGRTVYCLKPGEAKFNAQEMPSYFEHNISLSHDSIVFDVGAYIGLFSLWVYDHFGPNVRVYAFEPVPDIFAVLDANLRELPRGVATALPFGLSNAAGTTDFTYFPGVPSMSAATAYRPDGRFIEMGDAFVRGQENQGYPALRWLPKALRPTLLSFWHERILNKHLRKLTAAKQTLRCSLKTISDVIAEREIPRIDLLKIDCEGSEMDVVNGIDERDWPKVRQVVAELEDCSRTGGPLSQMLRERGFTYVEIDRSGWMGQLDIGLLYARR